MSTDLKKERIEAVKEIGNLLVVHVGESLEFWNYKSFKPSAVSEGIDFHTVIGYNVTEFITTNHISTGRLSLLNQLEETLKRNDLIEAKFHSSIIWRTYEKGL